MSQAYSMLKGDLMNAKSTEQRSGHLVLPGERLGVIEGFIPDSGTYSKDGVIYSKVVGCALMDMLNRRVSVYPLVSEASVPKVGTTVIGQVGNAQSDNVLVRIFRGGPKRYDMCCTKCGNLEKRKTAPDYGQETL